jgi:hypothetical protein
MEIEEGDSILDHEDAAAVVKGDFEFLGEEGFGGDDGDVRGDLVGGQFDAVTEHFVMGDAFAWGRVERDIGVGGNLEEAAGGGIAGDAVAVGVVGDPDGERDRIEESLEFGGALAFGVLAFAEGVFGVLPFGDFVLEVGVDLFELAAGLDGVFHEIEGGAVGPAEFDIGGMLLGFLEFHTDGLGGVFDAVDDAGEGAIGVEEGVVGELPVMFLKVGVLSVGTWGIELVNAEVMGGVGIEDALEGSAEEGGEIIVGVVGVVGVDVEDRLAEDIVALAGDIAEERIGDGEDGEAWGIRGEEEEATREGVEDTREVQL